MTSCYCCSTAHHFISCVCEINTVTIVFCVHTPTFLSFNLVVGFDGDGEYVRGSFFSSLASSSLLL